MKQVITNYSSLHIITNTNDPMYVIISDCLETYTNYH